MAITLQEHSPKKFWHSIRKSRKKSWLPSTVEDATGNDAVTDPEKKQFAELLNSSKNYTIGTFVKQNINSHEKFEGIKYLMCNSYKIKSLLQNLTLNRAAGKDGIFVNTFSMQFKCE